MKHLITLILVLLYVTPLNAKEYLGFNLCEKMTETQIAKVAKKTLTKNNGQLSEIKIFSIADYPVGKELLLDIQVKTFKDLVFEIEISPYRSAHESSPGIEEIIANKYGHLSDRETDDGFKRLVTFTYNTLKTDSNLELTLNFQTDRDAAGKFIGHKKWISYLCTPVFSNVNKSIKSLENKAIKEAEGKTKF